MRHFYALLLYLFPRSYRREYGDELKAVFSLSLDAATKTGKLEVVRVIVREWKKDWKWYTDLCKDAS